MATSETTPEHDERIANMEFSRIYPCYVTKVAKKGRTEDELITVLSWLTGFSAVELKRLVKEGVTIREFFHQATLHENARLITGVICGYRVENLTNPLTRKARYMDKVVDELAKGKTLEKIMRSS